MNNQMKNVLKALSIMFIIGLLILTACSNEPEELESGTLYIGTLSALQHPDVRSNWVDAFLHQHKEIDAEYMSVLDASYVNFRDPGEVDGAEKVKELLGGNAPPDIVALGYDDFQEAVAQNLLAPLDPMMRGSSLTEDRLEESVREYLRGPDAQLYGLAPVIRSSVLVYNKDLFDRAQIGYPTDGMTWAEVFALAEQMALDDGDQKIYGFTFGDRYDRPGLQDILNWYAAGSDLTLHDEQRMTVNNDGWRMLFDTLFQLSASGVFPLEEPESTYRSHPFLSGDTAMTVMRDMDVFELKQLHEQASSEGDFNPFQWDIVTVPVHEHARDQGAGIAYEPIFAISANARNPKTAWTLLEFMHSDQWVSMSLNPNQLLTFAHAGDSLDGNDNRSAFFQLRPLEHPFIRIGNFSRDPYDRDVQQLGSRLYTMMFMEMMTIDDVLTQWEREGNQLLQEK